MMSSHRVGSKLSNWWKGQQTPPDSGGGKSAALSSSAKTGAPPGAGSDARKAGIQEAPSPLPWTTSERQSLRNALPPMRAFSVSRSARAAHSSSEQALFENQK